MANSPPTPSTNDGMMPMAIESPPIVDTSMPTDIDDAINAEINKASNDVWGVSNLQLMQQLVANASSHPSKPDQILAT